jgi:hypothetical protein
MMEDISKEYGWTPKEIREQDYDDIMNYWKIMGFKRLKMQQEQRKIKTKR